jgi:DNA-binding MarR family transcriptional regulator
MSPEEILALASSLRSVVSDLRKRLRKPLNAEESYSITEIATLVHLYAGGEKNPTDLAVLNKVTNQSMSTILEKLEKADLITRTSSETDKRKRPVSLTPHGRKMAANNRYERDEWLRNTIVSLLRKEDIEVLAKAIPLLKRIADQVGD